MPLPTGGCASAACRMVHTISSISALSCLSDNTAETGSQNRIKIYGDTKHQQAQKQRGAKERLRFKNLDFIASSLFSSVMWRNRCWNLVELNTNRVKSCSYSLLLERVPPAEVLSYTPSLSEAPENFPTTSRPSKLHAHEARTQWKRLHAGSWMTFF